MKLLSLLSVISLLVSLSCLVNVPSFAQMQKRGLSPEEAEALKKAQRSGKPVYRPGYIEVEGAWSRATPATARSAVVYLTLLNRTGRFQNIVEVSSPIARMAEIHRTTTLDNGQIQMEPMERISLFPDNQVRLEPGGLHIMLMGLERPLKVDDEFPITFHIETIANKTKPVTARVHVKHMSYRPENENASAHITGQAK